MSLKSARKKFNTLLVEYISNNLDWTPTKKYTEKMCQFLDDSSLLINGSNDDIFNFLETMLSGFKLFDRYSINFEKKDITQYSTFNEFLKVIENYITNFTDNRIRSMFKVEGKLNPGVNLGTFNGYNIVKIDNFKEASKYSGYCSWCVTKIDMTFLEYVKSNKQFYFALKENYEQIKRQEQKDVPLDEYGLSMLALRVSTNGHIEVTTRWNHEYGVNKLNNNIPELNKLFGLENITTLLKPKTTETSKKDISKYIELSKLRLFLNIPYENIFDKTYVQINGYAIVSILNKENFIDVKNNKILSDYWFDGVFNFNEINGNLFALVNIKNKVNLFKINGEFISDLWFDDILRTPNNNFFIIKNNYLYNTMNMNGELINEMWFNDYVNNGGSFFRVKINKEYKYLNKYGKILIEKTDE